MNFADYVRALDAVADSYCEDSREGPSIKWLTKYRHSSRCTSLQRAVCNDIIAHRYNSWFLAARLRRVVPTLLYCRHSVFRQICEWQDANPGVHAQCRLSDQGILVVHMVLPRGLYTGYMGHHNGVIYYLVVWLDEDSQGWGIVSATSNACEALVVKGDSRISIATLVRSGGVLFNPILVASYSSRYELYAPADPATVEVAFHAQDPADGP